VNRARAPADKAGPLGGADGWIRKLDSKRRQRDGYALTKPAANTARSNSPPAHPSR
jgi:hypothetical protein